MGIAANLGALARLITSGGLVPAAALASDAALPSGMVQHFTRTTAPTGWMKANGQTIGSAASGATGRANADTLALYTVLWNDFTNAVLPIQDSAGAASTRGASAVADFAANKRLPLPDLRGEFIRSLDDGRGVDGSRGLGTAQTEAIGPHNHTGTADSAGAHTHTVPANTSGSNPGIATTGNGNATVSTSSAGAHTHTLTINNNSGTENRPRNVALLACIKL